eukprot:m.57504 g.57504  ORF g.57504 m.57504 type:complete len:740 (-) comp11601_c0_seq1:396-2615(-)
MMLQSLKRRSSANLLASAFGGHAGITHDQVKLLPYTPIASSPHLTHFSPMHLTSDNGELGASRWCAKSSDDAFVLLELEQPSIIVHMEFGKNALRHYPTDVSYFEVYGGLEPSCRTLMYSGKLTNTTQTDRITLTSHTSPGVACKYIKVVPLKTWGGPRYSPSLWYIGLFGITDGESFKRLVARITQRKQVEAIRTCLKHLRDANLPTSFQALSQESGVVLEHPLLSTLYTTLVQQGDFASAEDCISKMVEEKLFNQTPPLPDEQQKHSIQFQATRIHCDAGPPGRSAHGMVMDTVTEKIYVLGGWTGQAELGGLWEFDLNAKKWARVQANVSDHGGPPCFSCFAMCINSLTRKIYVFGQIPLTPRTPCKLYELDLSTMKWAAISDNPKLHGGPTPVYYCSMAINEEDDTLYISGGHSDDPQMDEGLYAFHVPSASWTKLRQPSKDTPKLCIQPRLGHATMFDAATRTLIISGGYTFNPDRKDLGDVVFYDTETDVLLPLKKPCVQKPLPSGVATYAAFDPIQRHITIVGGNDVDRTLAIWLYSMETQTWYEATITSASAPSPSEQEHGGESAVSQPQLQSQSRCGELPVWRSAHRVVFNPKNRKYYLFGGNQELDRTRLNDLWELSMARTDSAHAYNVKNHCVKMIRALLYREMAAENPIEALMFLRNQVLPLLDMSDSTDVHWYNSLASNAFKAASAQTATSVHDERHSLFQEISNKVIPTAREPVTSLEQLIESEI